jgi:hypothetical protein
MYPPKIPILESTIITSGSEMLDISAVTTPVIKRMIAIAVLLTAT